MRKAHAATGLHPYTVLTGIDFTPRGDEAFAQAAAIAARIADSELHVLHVLEARPAALRGAHAGELADELTREREKLSAWVAKESRRAAGIAGQIVGIHVRAGSPSREILQLATDLEADMLVIGGQPRSSFKGFLSSSLAQRLTRIAHCPVMVAIPKDYAHSVHTPHIEPACSACVQARRQSGGAQWWCEQHEGRRVQAHTYSYRRRLPLSTHDSEVVPTGVD